MHRKPVKKCLRLMVMFTIHPTLRLIARYANRELIRHR